MQAKNSLANAFRILAALFYHAPDDFGMFDVRSTLATPDWINEWPCGTKADLQAIATLFALARTDESAANLAALRADYQRLFIGPDALPAPAWGSIYLDEEGILYGASTFRLMAFCEAQGLLPAEPLSEPPDQFGLLCAMLAVCAEGQRDDLMRSLLTEFLLPWSGRFLTLFAQASAMSLFYCAAAKLAALSLDALQQSWQLSVPRVPLYR